MKFIRIRLTKKGYAVEVKSYFFWRNIVVLKGKPYYFKTYERAYAMSFHAVSANLDIQYLFNELNEMADKAQEI
jgi:hypothetical protein